MGQCLFPVFVKWRCPIKRQCKWFIMPPAGSLMENLFSISSQITAELASRHLTTSQASKHWRRWEILKTLTAAWENQILWMNSNCYLGAFRTLWLHVAPSKVANKKRNLFTVISLVKHNWNNYIFIINVWLARILGGKFSQFLARLRMALCNVQKYAH